MIKTIKSIFRRVFLKSRIDARYFLYFISFLLILAVYLFSKSQDRRIIKVNKQNELTSNNRILSSNTEIYRRKDKIYSSKIKVLEDEITNMQQQMNLYKEELSRKKNETKNNVEQVGSQTHSNLDEEGQLIAQVPQISSAVREFETSLASAPIPDGSRDRPKRSGRSKKSKESNNGPSIISFPVRALEKTKGDTVTIPSGSFVKAKLLTGIEAPEGKALPVLLQADYAFVGPNKSEIDLSGCFIIAKSTGNLSIERVEMQVAKISCVSRSGKSFERELSGFVADGKDNSFAVDGEVSSKRDQVGTMAFLSSVDDGISAAVSKVQTSTVRDAQGTSTMITGSQKKFIAANGASNTANTITNWYLQHAENLLPTINIGSGQEVWIVVQEKVQLPNWYFKKDNSRTGKRPYISNILK